MIDGNFAGCAGEQRVTVGSGFRDGCGRQHRTRTRAIFDNDRLAERRLHRVLQQAGDDIDAAAGRVADEDMHRLPRIS